MIIKILGILDILAGALFWASTSFDINIKSILIFFALYLIIKGTIFLISKDIASALDVISGILIYASVSYNLPAFVDVIVSLFLLQKGIFSLLS